MNTTITYPVVVDADGEVRPLLTLVEDRQVIRHKRKGDQLLPGPRTSTRIIQRWGAHPALIDWAARNGRTVAQHCRFIFLMIANSYTHAANGMIRVEVRKGKIVATFSVDVLRMPQFFDDRDAVQSARPGGRRARIFHIVRAHPRTLRNGKTIQIKAHFAGLREFVWHGYHVSITVPGRDHAALPDATFGAYDSTTLSPAEAAGSDWLDTRHLGKALATHIGHR
jgi:hypothetical protein